MNIYYHATSRRNFEEILKSKSLKHGYKGNHGVFFTKDEESVIEFAKQMVKSYKVKYSEMVVFKFKNANEYEESFRHNKAIHNGATAFVSYDDVELFDIEEINVGVDWYKVFKDSLV